jgi:hypothetical protein
MQEIKDQMNSITRNVMVTTGQQEADKAVRKNKWDYFNALGFMVTQYAHSNKTWYVKF